MVKLNEWMQILDGTTEFRDLTLPGSNNNQIHTHDIRDRPENTKTQTDNVATQFDNGSRWFDAELELNDFLVPFEAVERATTFTVPMEIEQLTGNVSGSTDVEEQLNQLKSKIIHNETEFVVLRVFNLKAGQHNQVSSILKGIFGDRLYFNSVPGSNIIEHSLAKAHVNDLRGCIVLLFDTFSNNNELKVLYSTNEDEPIHPHVSFNRHDEGGNTSSGCLNTYGTRLGIPDKSIRKVLEATLLKKTGAHSSNSFCNENPSHLFIVYMTGISSNVNGRPVRSTVPGGRAIILHKGTLMGPGNEVRRKLIPNVIMCDQVDKETSNEIIKLNYGHGIAEILFSRAVDYGSGITLTPEQIYQNIPDFQQPDYANFSQHRNARPLPSLPLNLDDNGYVADVSNFQKFNEHVYAEISTDEAGYQIPVGQIVDPEGSDPANTLYASFKDGKDGKDAPGIRRER
jgi:hypothetical protein